jgi:MFS family permease
MAVSIPNVGAEATLLIGGVLVVTGLLLAFWGHGIWAAVMSMIGALLGSAVGYLFGVPLGGDIAGLVLALVGAVIGSILFSRLVKVALAFLVGLLAGALVYSLLHGRAYFDPQNYSLDPPLIAALLVLVIVFGIAYYFIDDLIGIITAAIGGLLLAAGLYILNAGVAVAAAAGIGGFILGAIVQTRAINRKRQIREQQKAMAQAAAYPPAPPPPPPPP